jgi:hypothetical protein
MSSESLREALRESLSSESLRDSLLRDYDRLRYVLVGGRGMRTVCGGLLRCLRRQDLVRGGDGVACSCRGDRHRVRVVLQQKARTHTRIRQAREYPANQANHEAPAERSQPVSQSVAACVTLTCCLRLCCTRQS